MDDVKIENERWNSNSKPYTSKSGMRSRLGYNGTEKKTPKSSIQSIQYIL